MCFSCLFFKLKLRRNLCLFWKLLMYFNSFLVNEEHLNCLWNELHYFSLSIKLFTFYNSVVQVQVLLCLNLLYYCFDIFVWRVLWVMMFHVSCRIGHFTWNSMFQPYFLFLQNKNWLSSLMVILFSWFVFWVQIIIKLIY